MRDPETLVLWSILRGRRYNRTKKSMADAGAMKGKANAEVAQAPINTAAALAKAHGVSERTIKRRWCCGGRR